MNIKNRILFTAFSFLSCAANASIPNTPIPEFPITFSGSVFPDPQPISPATPFPGHIEVYLLNPQNPLSIPVPCTIKNSYPVDSDGKYSFKIGNCPLANKSGYSMLSLHYYSNKNSNWSLADALLDSSKIENSQEGSSVVVNMNYIGTQFGSTVVKNCTSTSGFTYADGFAAVNAIVGTILKADNTPYTYDEITSLPNDQAKDLIKVGSDLENRLKKICTK